MLATSVGVLPGLETHVGLLANPSLPRKKGSRRRLNTLIPCEKLLEHERIAIALEPNRALPSNQEL